MKKLKPESEASSRSDAPPAGKRDYDLMTDRRKPRKRARYSGFCGVCGRVHIKEGDEIQRDPYTKHWASRSCLAHRNSPKEIERKVKNVMLLKHNIWLGSFGKPEGAAPTSSYAEFFEKALALDVCNSQEFSTFREKMGEDAWHMKI